MTRDRAALIAALIGLVFLFKGKVAGARRLTVAEVKALAEGVAHRYFPAVDPLMLRAMVEIESARDPLAFRAEPHVNDASVGLMQTLEGTAQWLHDAMGARAFPRPTLAALADPLVSMYYGAAMVNWLRSYGGQTRPEEWIVRAYNGGPGGATGAATANHWAKYRAAKARLQQEG